MAKHSITVHEHFCGDCRKQHIKCNRRECRYAAWVICAVCLDRYQTEHALEVDKEKEFYKLNGLGWNRERYAEIIATMPLPELSEKTKFSIDFLTDISAPSRYEPMPSDIVKIAAIFEVPLAELYHQSKLF